MRMHVVQHVPFEGPAGIGEWGRERGHDLSVTRMFAGELLPDLDSVDWLVVMGGPMGVHDCDVHPWLPAETRYVGRAVKSGKGVLGVCLGAQIIARALGAWVGRNRDKEIGWFPVALTPAGREEAVFQEFPDRLEVLHWHGDTFAVPPGAVHAMSSRGCDNQAFVLDGGRVAGLQFHLEMDREDLIRLVTSCPGDMTPGPYVQPAATMLASKGFETLRPPLFDFLDRMASVIAA